MATVVKRRSASRKKSQKSSGRGGEVARRSWANEALSVVACAFSLFLLVSFLSARLSRPAIDVVLSPTLRNPMGSVGRFSGILLDGFFGWCALVPVIWLAWLSWYFWHRDDDEPLLEVRSKFLLLLGLAGMLTFSCSILSIVWEVESGGRIGAAVSSPLARLFGIPGATLIVGALLLSSIALTTRKSVGTIVRGLGGWLFDVLRFSVVQVPLFVFKIIGFLGGALALCGVGLKSLLFGSDKDERRLPSPRIRKNIVEEEEDEEIDEEEDIEESEETDEVVEEDRFANMPPAVVQRKTNDDRVGDKELRKVRKKVVEQMKEDEGYPEYTPPDLGILARGEVTPGAEDDEELREKSRLIENKLRDFGILGKVTQIHPGPVITLFEFEPAPGVKVNKIASLQDDLAMGLRASSIRIIAPIPKRGTVGIEVPNRHRDIVRLRDLLESEAFVSAESTLAVPIGKDTYGEPVVADIATMPHLLMAGTTGTGKSVCINAVLISLLYRASPAELGLILIDPKILELSTYDDIPHLRVPVVTVPRQAKAVLDWAVNEMNRRYRMMQKYGVRNIDSYNKVVSGELDKNGEPKVDEKSKSKLEDNVVVLQEEEVIEGGIVDRPDLDGAPIMGVDSEGDVQIAETLKPLPKILIVIDELADLMLTVGRDIEELITRLAQKARAAGIHLIVATQRPSVDVVTGLIKANFPARLSFRVATRVDSRTILDSMGADKLLGRGDMLLMLPGQDGLRRVHGAFVSDSEVKKFVNSIKSKCKPRYDERIMAICEKALEEDKPENANGEPNADEYDDMYDKCVELVVEKGQASTSMLQRAFRLGYNRAARIIDMMEREGIVGPMDGAKPREVRVPTEQQQQEGNG